MAMETTSERECEFCGMLYEPEKVGYKFCSRECSQAKYKKDRKERLTEQKTKQGSPKKRENTKKNTKKKSLRKKEKFEKQTKSEEENIKKQKIKNKEKKG